MQRIFVKKKVPKLPYFEELFCLKSPYLDNGFLQVAKIEKDSEFFLLFSLTCSQIWLIPLVDDH